MRTTLVIDDDVLAAAKGLAARQSKTLGEVVSGLARQGLLRSKAPKAATRNGIPLLQSLQRGKAVTLEMVNQVRDEAP